MLFPFLTCIALLAAQTGMPKQPAPTTAPQPALLPLLEGPVLPEFWADPPGVAKPAPDRPGVAPGEAKPFLLLSEPTPAISPAVLSERPLPGLP